MTFENKYLSIHIGKPFRFWFSIYETFWITIGHWHGDTSAYGIKVFYYEHRVFDIFDLRIGKFQVNISFTW